MNEEVVKALGIAQGKNKALESDEKDSGHNQGLLSTALNDINGEIEDGLIISESRELDIELHNAVKNEVDGAILEETKKVMKRQGSKLTQALVTRLYDRANTIGKAYIMKKVLKEKKPLYDALSKVAKGGTYTEETIFYNTDGSEKGRMVKVKQIPPNISALKYLFTKIDGSLHIAVATEVKESEGSIDDIIANDK